MNNNHSLKEQNLKSVETSPKKPRFLSLADNMLLNLNTRSQEIVRKRFGLSISQGETLEKIGQRYEITRERVRQIISEATRNIKARSTHADFMAAEETIIFTIKKNDGIIKESEIVEKFNSDGPKEANAIKFFANCSKKIIEVEEKGLLEKSWVVSADVIEKVKKVILEAENKIQAEKKSMKDEELFKKVSPAFPGLTRNEILNFLLVSAKIKKNKFGKWGMIGWMEINPKGTREKVYLILKEQKKPLHFTQIASLIDQFALGKRKAHPQTVHNELIKDKRFILIGRGIYALREWGYFEGTIRDILKAILEGHGAMSKDAIVAEVLKMRQVKKTTIMINLNNRKFFAKKGELYSVKK